MLPMISTRGCAVERSEGMTVGEKCELYFQWDNVVIGTTAQVVWRDAAGKVGLKFLSVDKDTQRRLGDLCATLSRRPLFTKASQEVETPRPAAKVAPPPATSLPKQTDGRERRRVPRYVSELPTRLANLHTGATSTATLVTLSVQGGCLEGMSLPEMGEECDLAAEWQGQKLLIQGVVVWKRKNQVGIKLVSTGPAAEQLLRQICSSLRLQPLTN